MTATATVVAVVADSIFFFYILFGGRYIAIYEHIDPLGWLVLSLCVCALMHGCISQALHLRVYLPLQMHLPCIHIQPPQNAFDPTDD